MFEESSYPDKIEVLQPTLHVQVRIANEVRKDGAIIAQSFRRYVLEPGADLTGQPELVIKICKAIWM